MGTTGTLRPHWMLLAAIMGCSAPNPNVRVTRLPNNLLQVEGPLAGPFEKTETLAAAACELMTRQPGAGSDHGRLGVEYCALYYYSTPDKAYFLSYLSDVAGERAGGVKYCYVPRSLKDRDGRKSTLLGPVHTHPHNPRLSNVDMGGNLEPGVTPLGPSRLHEPETNRFWDRELLVFFGTEGEPCLTHKYNYATRVVSALREGAWVPIGRAEGDYGEFKAYPGMGWLP